MIISGQMLSILTKAPLEICSFTGKVKIYPSHHWEFHEINNLDERCKSY